MVNQIKQGALFTIVTMVLLGGVYHAALWAIARAAFPAQAEGSLIRRADGTIVGSRLIAQKFTRPEYFHPRPSAVDYNAASTGGSNYGPSNPDHLKAVKERLDAVTHAERRPRRPGSIRDGYCEWRGTRPAYSASSSQSAGCQSRIGARCAYRARTGSRSRPHRAADVGLPGTDMRVNVLELNLDLDETFGRPTPASSRNQER